MEWSARVRVRGRPSGIAASTRRRICHSARRASDDEPTAQAAGRRLQVGGTPACRAALDRCTLSFEVAARIRYSPPRGQPSACLVDMMLPACLARLEKQDRGEIAGNSVSASYSAAVGMTQCARARGVPARCSLLAARSAHAGPRGLGELRPSGKERAAAGACLAHGPWPSHACCQSVCLAGCDAATLRGYDVLAAAAAENEQRRFRHRRQMHLPRAPHRPGSEGAGR